MQYEKSKDIFNKVIQVKLNRTNAVNMIKSLNLNLHLNFPSQGRVAILSEIELVLTERSHSQGAHCTWRRPLVGDTLNSRILSFGLLRDRFESTTNSLRNLVDFGQ